MAAGDLARAGLVTANSIHGGTNRKAVERILAHADIFDAWDDEPWVEDGASVLVSLICLAPRGTGLSITLDGQGAPRIGSDLSAARVDLTQARRLAGTAARRFRATSSGDHSTSPGPFAREWLRLPVDPSGRTNADALRSWVNGSELVRRPSDRWIIDFGRTMEIEGRAGTRRPSGMRTSACGRCVNARGRPQAVKTGSGTGIRGPRCGVRSAAVTLHPHAPGSQAWGFRLVRRTDGKRTLRRKMRWPVCLTGISKRAPGGISGVARVADSRAGRLQSGAGRREHGCGLSGLDFPGRRSGSAPVLTSLLRMKRKRPRRQAGRGVNPGSGTDLPDVRTCTDSGRHRSRTSP